MIANNKQTIINYPAKSALYSQKNKIKEKREKIKMYKILKQLSLKTQLLKNIQVYQNKENRSNNPWVNKSTQVFLHKQTIKNKIKV